jgi:hypothetical protein
MAKKTKDLIAAMVPIIAAAQPVTGRGIGYKLFVAGLIPSMSTKDMKAVYRLLKELRERGMIPWEWIVDESRQLEKKASWSEPDAFVDNMIYAYRKEYWDQQPVRVECWSEKGTMRGVLKPVLNEFGIGFRAVHGFASCTVVHDVAVDYDGRPLIVIYCGDRDPSGLYMSEGDLPDRLRKYKGAHVRLKRVALTADQVVGLPSFPAADKSSDTRYDWFVRNYGYECWEIDAMDPNALRDCVRAAIEAEIEPEAWERCKTTERAEESSLRWVLNSWSPGRLQGWGLNITRKPRGWGLNI